MSIRYKWLFIILLIYTYIEAKEYEILLFSAKKVYPDTKKIFFKRFPNGVIKKYDKYYEFKTGPFSSYKIAKEKLKITKKFYKDAFIINSSLVKSKVENVKTSIIKKSFIEKTKKTIYQKEPVKSHKPIEPLPPISKNGVPLREDPTLLRPYEIPDTYKTEPEQMYDLLSFKKYISTLLSSNDKVKEIFYKKRVDYILQEIKKDRYNFDVYIDGYLRTGSSISAQSGNAPNVNGEYSGAGVAIHANKLLYDGGYNLIKHTYDILYKRLADIDAINAKNSLLLLGVSIYSNYYISQEELKIYKKIYDKQKSIVTFIKEGYKNGKNSPIDLIDARNDLFNLKRTILNLRYGLLDNDFILRHSIKAKSKKPYKLSVSDIKFKLESLSIIQKEALVHSGLIARESNRLKIKETDLLFQLRRRYPTFRFHSYLGYGLSTNKSFDLSNPGKGAFWEVGLDFKLPIYNRDDINLKEERERLNILKQKSIMSQKARDILIKVEQNYNLILKLKREIKIVLNQLSLMKQKLKISKVRYMNGISPYRDYSTAFKGYLLYQDQLIKLKESLKRNIILLNIFIGKKVI